jgi:hypothetical protein
MYLKLRTSIVDPIQNLFIQSYDFIYQEHCYCDTCVNYRPVDIIGDTRFTYVL